MSSSLLTSNEKDLLISSMEKLLELANRINNNYYKKIC